MSYVSEMHALIGHKSLLLAGATVLSGPEYRFTYPNGDQIRQLPPLESRAAQVIRVIRSLSFDRP